MNPNEKELLEKTYEMSRENNNILRGIRNSNRWSAVFKIFYWLVIVGISVGAFYYIQPYIEIANKAYNSIQGDLTRVKSVINTIPGTN